MHSRERAALSITGLASLALLAAAGPAWAAPVNAPNAFPITLECDNDSTYDAVVAGNGEFSVAHDTNSRAILVPTQFGEFVGTITDEAGTVLDSFVDPALSKGSSTRERRTSTTCTFSITETFEDPTLGLITFTGSGDVTGFVTPAKGR